MPTLDLNALNQRNVCNIIVPCRVHRKQHSKENQDGQVNVVRLRTHDDCYALVCHVRLLHNVPSHRGRTHAQQRQSSLHRPPNQIRTQGKRRNERRLRFQVTDSHGFRRLLTKLVIERLNRTIH